MCLKTGLCSLSECGSSEFNPFLQLTKAYVPNRAIHFLLQVGHSVRHARTFSRSPSQLVGWLPCSLARSLARGDDSLNRIPLATANLASSLSPPTPSFDRSAAANPTERAARAASYTHCKGDFFTQWQADQYFKC